MRWGSPILSALLGSSGRPLVAAMAAVLGVPVGACMVGIPPGGVGVGAARVAVGGWFAARAAAWAELPNSGSLTVAEGFLFPVILLQPNSPSVPGSSKQHDTNQALRRWRPRRRP